ncbi:MAG: hypothetical protein R2769_07310 [Saprospiraceae bacterium]
MKKLLITLTVSCFATLMFAQNAAPQAPTKASISDYFQFDNDQQVQLNSILDKKAQAQNEAKSLKDSDPQTYLNKLNIASEMYYMELRNMMTDEQKKMFPDWVKENGKRKSVLEKQLRSEGVSDLEIRIQVAEKY